MKLVIVMLGGLLYSTLSATCLAADSPLDLKKMDLNDDGAIDLSESTKRGISPQRFKALDRDHDGRLTPDELALQGHPPQGSEQPFQEAPGRAEGPTEN